MAIVELFGEAEKAAAEVKTAQLAMEAAQISHEKTVKEANELAAKTIAESASKVDVATKSYAEAVNKMQDLRIKIDAALGGILTPNSSVRQYS